MASRSIKQLVSRLATSRFEQQRIHLSERAKVLVSDKNKTQVCCNKETSSEAQAWH